MEILVEFPLVRALVYQFYGVLDFLCIPPSFTGTHRLSDDVLEGGRSCVREHVRVGPGVGDVGVLFPNLNLGDRPDSLFTVFLPVPGTTSVHWVTGEEPTRESNRS